ncbi:reverse transcriptase family protein [Athalassotoga saccharophila]|uniref:RNA-directed DNA polymerase n=1 Tax=Athalassotoga saccharophila TaxID=1441386 RepID=UPI00158127B5|nr:RNA-directed DNA polymerase [Athalassotoga saccharophila]BBJ28538.1 retron-type RNA-directed DNA polymerase [Athalassotoga saccharophila]
METKLARIAQIAKERPKERFTSLAHLINEEMLLECHNELKANKAAGVDEVTKAEYEENLQENIKRLHESLKDMTYIPQPVRRVYIPKPGKSELRPLGIPACEDKIVKLAISKILRNLIAIDISPFVVSYEAVMTAGKSPDSGV